MASIVQTVAQHTGYGLSLGAIPGPMFARNLISKHSKLLWNFTVIENKHCL